MTHQDKQTSFRVGVALDATDLNRALWQEFANLRRRVEELEALGTEVPGGVEDDVPPCPICGQDHVPGMTTGRSGTQYYCGRKLPSGFYWVKFQGKWMIVEYDQKSAAWYAMFGTEPIRVAGKLFDQDLDTIGPRIHPPEE